MNTRLTSWVPIQECRFGAVRECPTYNSLTIWRERVHLSGAKKAGQMVDIGGFGVAVDHFPLITYLNFPPLQHRES
jgi:hypothetical protein